MSVLTAADLGRTPKGVDAEEKRQINLEIDNTESYMVACAATHHTVDTKAYVKSAARAVKVITELPHSSQAEQVADALERGQLALLLSNASNAAAPAAALPGNNNVQTSDTEQRLQQENAALRQMIADMLSTAHINPRPNRQILDDKDDILRRLEEQRNWADDNWAQNQGTTTTVAMTEDEIKATDVYKAADRAKTAAEGKITMIAPIANNIKALVAKGELGRVGSSVKFTGTDHDALEAAAKDLVTKLAAPATTP